jgi:hypothetical protein
LDEAASLLPDPPVKEDDFERVARSVLLGLLAETDMSAAQATAQKAATQDEKQGALYSIVTGLARKGRFEDAHNTANLMISNSMKAEAVFELRTAEIAARASAPDTVDHAHQFALGLRNLQLKSTALRKLGTALSKAGDSRAFGVFLQAEEAATLIPDAKDNIKRWMTEELAIALANAGYYAEAERVANTVKEGLTGERSKALCEVAKLILGKEPQGTDAREQALAILASLGERVHFNATQELAELEAMAGKFSHALAHLSCKSLSDLIVIFCRWIPSFDASKRGLSLEVLRESLTVAAWVNPHLGKVANLFRIVPPRTSCSG